MGCDIHIVAERKNPATGLYEPWGTFTELYGSFVQDGPKEFLNEIYEGRNYTYSVSWRVSVEAMTT